MIEPSIIITIIPPIATGVFAYLIARKKNVIMERLNKAKLDAEIQTQALTIVSSVMNSMRDEFRREIDGLKEENHRLRKLVDENGVQITNLTVQLSASDQLVETLQSEIAALRNTIRVYEEEIARLKK